MRCIRHHTEELVRQLIGYWGCVTHGAVVEELSVLRANDAEGEEWLIFQHGSDDDEEYGLEWHCLAVPRRLVHDRIENMWQCGQATTTMDGLSVEYPYYPRTGWVPQTFRLESIRVQLTRSGFLLRRQKLLCDMHGTCFQRDRTVSLSPGLKLGRSTNQANLELGSDLKRWYWEAITDQEHGHSPEPAQPVSSCCPRCGSTNVAPAGYLPPDRNVPTLRSRHCRDCGEPL